MNIENMFPSDDQWIGISEAEAIVWNAGETALANDTPKNQREILAEEFGVLFGKLATMRAAADIISSALPKGEDPVITFSSLTDHITHEIGESYQNSENPFMTNDRIAALYGLNLQLGASKNAILDQ